MSLLVKRSLIPTIANEIFNHDSWWSDFGLVNGKTSPSVNVIENNDAFLIEVAAPGLEKNDFHIDVENRVLTISSEKEENTVERNGNYVRKEFSYGLFKRSFSLSELVAEDKIKATYRSGILSIEIPKMEEAKVKPAKEIKIS